MVLLLPVTLTALAAYKLLELVPHERYRVAAGGAAVAGILLPLCLNFSLAGPGFVAAELGKFAAGTVRNSLAQMKAILFHTPVQPEPKEPLDWRYAGRVAGSSRGWGLTVAGFLALLRKRGRATGPVPRLREGGPTRQEKQLLEKIARTQHPAGGFLLGGVKRAAGRGFGRAAGDGNRERNSAP